MARFLFHSPAKCLVDFIQNEIITRDHEYFSSDVKITRFVMKTIHGSIAFKPFRYPEVYISLKVTIHIVN